MFFCVASVGFNLLQLLIPQARVCWGLLFAELEERIWIPQGFQTCTLKASFWQAEMAVL